MPREGRAEAIPLRGHRDGDVDDDRSWLVRELIATTGKALLPGQ